MKIKKLKEFSYFETQGGPICICDANNMQWSGATTDNSDYWIALSMLSSESDYVLTYKHGKEKYFILNNENNGFFILKDDLDNLIILEIFYVDNAGNDINWEEQTFDILKESTIDMNLTNGCLIFVSSLPSNILTKKKDGFLKIDSLANNYYCTTKTYANLKKISIKNKSTYVEGVILS
jgi:hypothetical protein